MRRASFRGAALIAVSVLATFGLATHQARADWPNGSSLAYNHCYANNVLAHPTKVIVGYWGWTGYSSYLEDAARAFASGDWRSSHVVTQYYQSSTCGAPFDNVTLSAMPVTIASLMPGPTTNYPSLAEEQAAAAWFLRNEAPNTAILMMAFPQSVHPVCEVQGRGACHKTTADDVQGYIDWPYAQDIQGLSGLLQHETAEVITDPLLAHGSYDHSAWWAQIPGDSEIADVCQNGAPVRKFQLLPSSQPESVFGRPPLQSNKANNGSGGCVFAYSDREDDFVLGTDSNIYISTNASGSWASLGHPAGYTLVSAPTASSHDPRFIDVFAVTSTGDMFQTATQNAGLNWTQWSNWGHPTGYTILGKPTLTSWGASRLDFYVTAKPTQGITNALFHRIWDDGVDSGWQQVNTGGFIPGTAPGAASWGPSNVVLAVLVGAPANLWFGTSSDGQTFTWTAAGNNGLFLDANAAPDVGSHDEGTADVFMTDLGGNLQHYWIANGVTGWDTLGNSGTPVKAGTGPAVVGRGDNRLIVSYTGNDNSVWQREYDFGWKSWARTLWPNGTYKDGDISSW